MEATEKCHVSAEQLRRLGNRWVFDCANRLITEEGLERKRAFGQAAKAYHLLEKLGFVECGTIYVDAHEKHSPRVAYERV